MYSNLSASLPPSKNSNAVSGVMCLSPSSVSEAIRLLLRHIGIESCRLMPSSDMKTAIPHNLSLAFLEQCCDLLSSAMTGHDWENCQAIIVTLLVSRVEGVRARGVV